MMKKSEIKEKADQAYSEYLRLSKLPDCLGINAKIRTGKFFNKT